MEYRALRRRVYTPGAPLAVLVVLLLLAPSISAAPAGPVGIDRDPPDCTQIPPEEMPSLTPAADETLDLDVRVLAEKRDVGVAKRHMRTTVWAFERIGIEVDATYDTVEVPVEWKGSAGVSPDRSAEELWTLVKDRYRGKRPEGADVVYYFTRYWGGGMADCIGGVRYPDMAFAFGSIDYALEGVIPMPTIDEGVIAAHEIGHLLGAHHHYSNCAEAAPQGATEGMAAACTTMSPFATSASPIFGSLERSFVRFYTERYAQAR